LILSLAEERSPCPAHTNYLLIKIYLILNKSKEIVHFV
jgi:hypothetical protein